MIKISLPNPTDYKGKGGIKQFLRQLELSVHHAQKAYEEIEKDDMFTEDAFVAYRFPRVGSFYDLEQDNEGFVKVHVDDESSDFQNIEIEISE